MRIRIITLVAALFVSGSFLALDAQEAGRIEIDASTENLILQSHRKRLDWTNPDNIHDNLVLAIITDLHGDAANLARFVEFCDRYDSLIDDRYELGDIVPCDWKQDFTFYLNTPGADRIKMAIGNHDTRDCPDYSNWTCHAGPDAYGKFFAPFASKWLADVAQPEAAAEKGICWYYKDYTVQRVRVIVLDSMSWCDAQTAWLSSVLNDALAKGLSVVCAQHLPVGVVNPVSTFNSRDCGSYAGGYSGSPLPILKAVQSFIDAGGEFISWFSGDSHADFTGTLVDFPRQFSVTFENGSGTDEWNDSWRAHGTKSQDSFNIVTFDTTDKLLKVVRIGDDTDRYLVSKRYFCYNYKTGELISNQ